MRYLTGVELIHAGVGVTNFIGFKMVQGKLIIVGNAFGMNIGLWVDGKHHRPNSIKCPHDHGANLRFSLAIFFDRQFYIP